MSDQAFNEARGWLRQIPRSLRVYVLLPGAIAFVVVVIATLTQFISTAAFITTFLVMWAGMVTVAFGRWLFGAGQSSRPLPPRAGPRAAPLPSAGGGRETVKVLRVVGLVVILIGAFAMWEAYAIAVRREFVATNVKHRSCDAAVVPTADTTQVRVRFKSLSSGILDVTSLGAPRSDRSQGSANPLELMTVGPIEKGVTLEVVKRGQGCIERLVVNDAPWHLW